MKRAIVLVAGVLMLTTPAQAVTWGPGESGVSPVYDRPIPIVDTLIGTLSPEHRRIWRGARDEALRQWGLPFTVTRGTLTVPWIVENIDSGRVAQNLTPGAITIIRDTSGLGMSQGGYDIVTGGGSVILSPWRPWWRRGGASEITGVIAHEVGHALGFWHGGRGVMSGSIHVNQEERDLARAYYEALGFIF